MPSKLLETLFLVEEEERKGILDGSMTVSGVLDKWGVRWVVAKSCYSTHSVPLAFTLWWEYECVWLLWLAFIWSPFEVKRWCNWLGKWSWVVFLLKWKQEPRKLPFSLSLFNLPQCMKLSVLSCSTTLYNAYHSPPLYSMLHVYFPYALKIQMARFLHGNRKWK